MPVRRASFLLSAAVLGAVIPARADPTKQQCVAANESAQDLQRAGKLTAAREQLALCVSESCPAAIRQDCSQKLDDVVKTTPTLVFAAKQPNGDDLVAVRVKIDGTVLVDHLDGNPVQVDPGQHRFTFESDGFVTGERALVVRTAEKDRVVEVQLRPAERVRTTPPPVTPTKPVNPIGAEQPKPHRTLVAPTIISFAAGAAGAVVGGILTALWVQAKQDGDAACGMPGSCDPATASSWESQQQGYSIGLGIAFGVAVVGIGLGLTFLVAGNPKAATTEGLHWGPRGLGVTF